jgi:D-tyrosyl-tRNA(Tyr) deacylase
MLCLIQRVTEASVRVDGNVVGRIGHGLLALVGVEPGDGAPQLARMTARLLGYRVFADAQGRMNRSLTDTGGGCCW